MTTQSPPDKRVVANLTTDEWHRLFAKPLPDGRILIEALADALCPGWREEGKPAA